MSDLDNSAGVADADAAQAGALLRAARQQQGLHIAALAASIKVAPAKLEALEAGRVHALPDATFFNGWDPLTHPMQGDPSGIWQLSATDVGPGSWTATVDYGGQVGAQVLEGYPTEPADGKSVIWDEASVGLLQVFLDVGYEVVASPTLRRSSTC